MSLHADMSAAAASPLPPAPDRLASLRLAPPRLVSAAVVIVSALMLMRRGENRLDDVVKVLRARLGRRELAFLATAVTEAEIEAHQPPL